MIFFSFFFPFTRGPRQRRIKYGAAEAGGGGVTKKGNFRAREGRDRWERGRRQVEIKKKNLKEEVEKAGKRR